MNIITHRFPDEWSHRNDHSTLQYIHRSFAVALQSSAVGLGVGMVKHTFEDAWCYKSSTNVFKSSGRSDRNSGNDREELIDEAGWHARYGGALIEQQEPW